MADSRKGVVDLKKSRTPWMELLIAKNRDGRLWMSMDLDGSRWISAIRWDFLGLTHGRNVVGQVRVVSGCFERRGCLRGAGVLESWFVNNRGVVRLANTGFRYENYLMAALLRKCIGSHIGPRFFKSLE